MDVPADRSRSTSAPPIHPSLREAVRSPRRRRPTGAAPPLPYRLQTSGIGWLVAALVLIGLTLVIFGRGLRGPAVTATVIDDAVVSWLAGLVSPGLVVPLRGVARISSWWVLYTAYYGLALALLVLRRWRHLVLWLVVVQLEIWLTFGLAAITQRPRPFGVELQTSWGGWALPSMPITILTAALLAVLYTLVPEGRWRNTGKWLAATVIALAAVARIALGVDAPTDVLVGVGIGVTLPLLLFRRFTPNEVYPVAYRRGRSAHLDVGGARGQAIRRALADQLGLVVEEVRPFGLSGSAGSTPLRITVQGDPPRVLFGKLYAQSHLRADRWYKLGRELLYGRLEDEKPFNSVRRLVQQEDYALSLMQRAGLPSPKPYGIAQLTPEREYLIVFEFIQGAKEIGQAEVDDAIIDQGLAIIRRLWDANLAHRDIKPANLLVRDNRLYLIDVFFAEIQPSPWRQAVDLANMLLCLALRSSPRQVYERALRQFSVAEITEAFAAARGLALPSQLRRMMRDQGRDLAAEFVRLLPAPPRPISVQRWSARRVVLLVLLVLALIPAVPMAWAFAQSSASPGGGANVTSGNGSCTQLEELWLQAQSVPSASRIPCVRAFPDGMLGDLRVRDGESVLELSHASVDINIGTGGQPQASAEAGSVIIRLTAGCDRQRTGAGQVIGPAVRRFQLQGSGRSPEVVDVFPGGCVTYRPGPDLGRSASLLDQAEHAVIYRTRDDLRQALRLRSGGRLQLDP
jgi:tRNA A-37 threonylcarbamoyl transferase component Bud32